MQPQTNTVRKCGDRISSPVWHSLLSLHPKVKDKVDKKPCRFYYYFKSIVCKVIFGVLLNLLLKLESGTILVPNCYTTFLCSRTMKDAVSCFLFFNVEGAVLTSLYT